MRIEYIHVVLVEPRIALFTVNGTVVVAQILNSRVLILLYFTLLYFTLLYGKGDKIRYLGMYKSTVVGDTVTNHI